MRAYSQANLLQEELQSNWNRKNVFTKAVDHFLRQSYIILTLYIPKPLYFRGEILCEDIEELSGMAFGHEDLLSLLYQDFLIYLRKHQSLEIVYNDLSRKNHQLYDIRDYRQDKKSNVFQSDQRANTQTLMFRAKRREILRGEVVLSDLAEVYPDHPFTLEHVLEMLYCDFIEKYRRGEREEAVSNILKAIDED